MKHNDPPNEVNVMSMSKDEVIGLLEAVKIISEIAEQIKAPKLVSESITRIQDKMKESNTKEPNAQAVASETR